jgi:uncharacterized protein (TIGR03000 family)
MTKFARPLCVALLSAAVVLLLAGTSQAQNPGRPFPPNRMPGWDWWRTYPWSPYNYGRNPYNPVIVPYVQPYPIYTPYYAPSYAPSGPAASYTVTGPTGAPVNSLYGAPVNGHADSPPQVPVPHPAGGVTVPPADAAVIRLYIPDRFGDVSFDGVKTPSIGTTRYYVTPDLGGKTLSYNVTARFAKGGQTVTEERKVTIGPGRTAEVDFR